MEYILYYIDFILHLDKHLQNIIELFGIWTYLLLFLIIFCETGLVVTPILPGDSLLFAAGTFAAIGALDVRWLIIILGIAAILGDTVNYWIGNYIGPKAFSGDYRFFKKEYLVKTQEFYETHGGKTIIIARFVPIIRTFAPFVAGIGTMNYTRFLVFNMTGAILWMLLFILGGYAFGNIPLVKKNFTLAIMAIILISIMPGIIEFAKAKLKKKR